MTPAISDPLIKLMLDNLTAAVVLINQQYQIEYINGSAENIFAISKVKLLQQSIEPLLNHDEETLHILRHALESGHPYTKREVCLSIPTKENKWVDLSITPLFLPSTENKLLIEIYSIERMMRISKDEAIFSAHQTTKALMRGMAHEIKNPLGGIRGAAQLLAREIAHLNLTEYTEVIIHETDRLKNLVDKMLGPKQRLQLHPTNIHQVLERVLYLADIENRDMHASIRFIRDYDISLPDIQADFEQLIQAILNVIKNACEALLENHIPSPTIEVKTRIIRQHTINQRKYRLMIRIDITDNGPGIPTDLIENIFYPMISGRPNGTGLGLSIAQGIVQQHQGIIECESQKGHTRFSILLPLEQPHD